MELPQFGQMTVFSGEFATPEVRLRTSKDSPSIVFLSASALLTIIFLAILANAVDLKGVAAGQVMMFSPNLLFDSANLGGKELH